MQVIVPAVGSGLGNPDSETRRRLGNPDSETKGPTRKPADSDSEASETTTQKPDAPTPELMGVGWEPLAGPIAKPPVARRAASVRQSRAEPGVRALDLDGTLRTLKTLTRHRILDHGSWIQDPGSGILIQDPGSRIQDHGSWLQDPGSRMLDSGSWIQNPGSRNQDSGSDILDPGSKIQDPGSHFLDPRSWIPGKVPRLQFLCTGTTI